MKKSLTLLASCLTALLILSVPTPSASAAALDSGFSYQGRLFDGGVPAGGSYDMVFALRDRATEGALVGAEQALDAVVVTNGLFQVTLDFGTNVWDASALWLDVSVRSNGTQTAFTLLTPSQRVRAVPYAIHAIKAGELVGNLPGTQLSGIYPNAVSMVNSGNAFAGSGAGLTALNGSQVTSGTIADARIDNALARDSELLSVSNALSGRIGSQSSALTGTITTTSNGLSDRLIATNGVLVTLVADSSNGLSGRLVSTNAALVSLVTTSSNGLQFGIDAEGTARAALVTKLETGNNTFAGSNHFSGIATLTNVNNVLAGNGSALTALNGTQVTSGTIADARIDSTLARDSELLSVSNALSGQIGSQSSTLTGTITTTSNGLSDRLIATNGVLVTLVADSSNGLSGRLVSTNAALVSLVTTSSNGLQSGIDAEGTARAALVTKLETGNNSFAGSNLFSGIATLTNMNNVLAGNGSALTALNGAQVTSGTIDDARIDNALARDSELLSVSNALSGQIGSQSSALTGTITTTSNGLSDRLIATNGVLVTLVADSSNGLSGRLVSTNAALVSLVTTSSNGLQSGIDAEGTARAALVTKLETGNNSFAGSNHFSGIVTLTNATNTLAGDGSALTGLNADQLTSGTISAARLPSGVVIDDGESGVSLQGGLSAASISGSGSGLTSLNASQLTSGTVPDARLDSVITRDTELSSVSSGLSANLVATNAALVSLVTTSSNGLRSSIEAESTARAALVTKLETGNNTFAGSNHFSGIVTLTNSDNVIAGVWRTGGNSGTSPGSDFIGTSDNQALEFQVNGARALKIAPESDSAPSITGGSSANSIATGVRGAVIAGGGEVFDGDGTFFRPNTILAGNFSAIGGGQQNTNSGAYAVIGGGGQNSVEANSFAATIGGGGENLVAGSGNYAAIGGGRGNAVTNRYASVPGGLDNRAGGQYSFAAGRRAKADADGAFVWADSQNADFISAVADSFNLRARGGVNVQAGTGSIAITGGLLTYNGNEVLTNGAAAALTSSNNFSANNTFAATNVFGGSNHFGGVLVATNAANVFVGSGAALSGLWKTSGNGGTSPGTDFVGTTDNEALVFKANNLQVMRLTPAVDEGAPNILMGAEINSIGSGVFGATISGGGAADFMNEGSASNIVNANYSTIGGGVGNLIDVNGYAGTIGGGVDNTVNTNADRSVISGGTGNEIARDTYAGSIGGGSGNYLDADTDYSTIAGGSGNNASSQYVAIGGGQNNTVSGLNGFVGGGVGNNLTGSADYSGVASGNNNDITGGKYSFVGGGQNNTIISGADKSAIGSGIGNTVKATGSFLGSGFNNLIGNGGVSWAFIGAGAHNAIPNGNADSGVIGGGQYNTNSGSFTVIGGGYSNYVSDFYGTVPGGLSNSVSGYCGFAAGRHAASVHSGSFVWADATTTSNYSSTIANEFRVKATGGINFETTDRAKITINGVRLMNVNDDGFAQSDYRVKKNFQPIDTLEVVDKLAAMPVERWNYKKEGDHEVPHIGPYAQDFKQAFYPGRDDTKISWLEFHGVELAAIQGLNKKLESKEQEINLLRDELAQLRAMVMEMRKNEGQ